MSDLISRQAVLDILENERSLRCGYDADIAIFSIEKGVRELSTAYDVEKVVGEIKKLDSPYDADAWFVRWFVGVKLDKAIDIVRKGGVE